MKKVFAFIAAFVVLSSIVADGLTSTVCECPETAKVENISSSDVKTNASNIEVARSKSSPTISAKVPESAHTVSLHDCHFGHCGFTIKFYSPINQPIDHLTAQVSRPYAAIPIGYRSETLRPPSYA